jgi:hypothetical protein
MATGEGATGEGAIGAAGRSAGETAIAVGWCCGSGARGTGARGDGLADRLKVGPAVPTLGAATGRAVGTGRAGEATGAGFVGGTMVGLAAGAREGGAAGDVVRSAGETAIARGSGSGGSGSGAGGDGLKVGAAARAGVAMGGAVGGGGAREAKGKGLASLALKVAWGGAISGGAIAGLTPGGRSAGWGWGIECEAATGAEPGAKGPGSISGTAVSGIWVKSNAEGSSDISWNVLALKRFPTSRAESRRHSAGVMLNTLNPQPLSRGDSELACVSDRSNPKHRVTDWPNWDVPPTDRLVREFK